MSYPQYSFQHSVLVINDLGKSEKILRSLLSYPVQFEFCPSDYDQAIAKLSQQKPDLIVVSLDFKKGSVIEFAKKARNTWANLPSLYLTEPHLIELQNTVQQLGEIEVISYPLADTSELMTKVDYMVRGLPTQRQYRLHSGEEKIEFSVG